MRQKSLSPLSKRMALMSNTDQSLTHTDNAYNQAYGNIGGGNSGGGGGGGMAGLGVADDPTNDEYELRVSIKNLIRNKKFYFFCLYLQYVIFLYY